MPTRWGNRPRTIPFPGHPPWYPNLVQILEVDNETYRILRVIAAERGLTIAELIRSMTTRESKRQSTRLRLRRIEQD